MRTLKRLAPHLLIALTALALLLPGPILADDPPSTGTGGGDAAIAGLNVAGKKAGFEEVRTPTQLVGGIINVVLSLTGMVFVGILIYAGIMYLTAGGEEDKVNKAKRMMGSAVIGIVIVVSAYAISTFVFAQLQTVTTAGTVSGTVQ